MWNTEEINLEDQEALETPTSWYILYACLVPGTLKR